MKNDDFKNTLIRRSFNLAKSVLVLTDKFPNKRSAWIITDQLIRAVTSIGANIIEAQAASSKKDFITVNRTPRTISPRMNVEVSNFREIREANQLTVENLNKEKPRAFSPRKFINFLNHALKSGNESKFWLALAKNVSPNLLEEINVLLKEVDELTKILGSSIFTLRSKNKL